MVSEIDVVTGSFSYTGRYITRRLIASGRQVRTLTGHPCPADPMAGRVPAFAYDFTHPECMIECLSGAHTLYNTYWVRFPYGRLNYDVAVQNLQALIEAAVRAGTRKLVHISIVNASEDSPYAYFRGKAQVERAIRESGLAYTILRPTLIFGPEDILVNNIAWMTRTFPVFLMAGSGDYLVQPIHVEDLARLAVDAGLTPTSEILDVAGPELLSYRELVEQVAAHVGRNVRLVTAPPCLVYWAAAVMGRVLDDTVLTYEELLALKDGVLYSTRPPKGTIRIREWLAAYGDRLGREYRSELRRHFR